MKSLPLFLLLGVAIPVAYVQAQQPETAVPATAPVPFKTKPEEVLTADYVRGSDYILLGRLNASPQQPELYRVASTGREVIKGEELRMGIGLNVPEEGRPSIAPTALSLIFGKYDPVKGQMLITARIDGTEENVARARELAAQSAALKFSFTSDKNSYAAGEDITLNWEVQNASPAPLKIYIGPYALQYGSTYDNTSHSTGTGGSHNRKPEDYKTLAPGEKWAVSRTIKGPFPQGNVGIEMTYESMDNFLGSDSNRRQAKERIEGVAMVKETKNFSVKVEPPSASQQKALLAKLASANWYEAMGAASILAEIDNIDTAPEFVALAKHPWPSLRIKALRGLSKKGVWTPELRALLFDRDRRVRSETAQLISRRSIPGASLSMLAYLAVEDEAQKQGYSNAKGTNIFAGNYLVRTRDKSIGDLLAARLEKGDGVQEGVNAAYVVNYLAENMRNLRFLGEKPPTDDEKTAILAAWKANRGEVAKPVTQADYDAEVQFARKAIYGDFKVSPDWSKVVTAMQKLQTSFWPNTTDENRVALENLPAASRTDVLKALRWMDGPQSGTLENAPPLRVLAQIEEPLAKGAAFEYLLSRAYSGMVGGLDNYVGGDTQYLAPILLAQMDFAKAKPHLEVFLNSDKTPIKLGAVVALAANGDKRGVPVLLENSDNFSFRNFDEVNAALTKATGQTFANTYEWKKWWTATGSALEWK